MEYSNNHERKSRSHRVTDTPPWTASPNGELPLVPTTLPDVASASILGRKFAPMKPSSQKDWLRYAMEALKKLPLTFAAIERKWVFPLLASTLISVVLLLLATFSVKSSADSIARSTSSSIIPVAHALDIVVDDPASELPPPPRLAYLISGTKGDGKRMQRTLQAVYHPRNYYLLHLDLEAPARERLQLARYVKSEVVFGENGNVYVVGRANLVTYRGPTMIATTLHGTAILMKKAKDWDWFINLSAADYPLVTQDGMFTVTCNSELLRLFLRLEFCGRCLFLPSVVAMFALLWCPMFVGIIAGRLSALVLVIVLESGNVTLRILLYLSSL